MAGSRFVRADLHVHSRPGANEPAGDGATLRDIVEAARAQGVSVVAITDHNTAVAAREAVALGGADLLVLPGIEISTAEGHLLGIFSPESVDALEDLTRQDVLRMRDLAGGGQQSTRSMAELIDEIAARDGLAILAHVDTAEGLLARANPATLSNIITRPGLAGIEITRHETQDVFTDADADEVRKNCWRERQQVLGSKTPIAHVMSSDAHSVAEIGVDADTRTLTRLRLDELSFHGVRAALKTNPSARCRLEADLDVGYPHVIRATFTGGFLNGLELEPSANLTCLIGSRGSGKTTALRAIQAALGQPISTEDDGHPNMPDHTDVEFRDSLGSLRSASRDRYGIATDSTDGVSPIRLPTIDLEQNFGMEFLDESPDKPDTTMSFLSTFIDTGVVDSNEINLETALAENATAIKSTAAATGELKKLRDEQNGLNASLKAAADNRLADVATYARILAAERPLLQTLIEQLGAIPLAELPSAPDVEALAIGLGVDLAERPAAEFIADFRSASDVLTKQLAEQQEATRATLAADVAPLTEVIKRWREKHEAWEAEIAKRRDQLKEAGLTLEVEHLERIRARLGIIEADVRKFTTQEATHKAALRERKTLVADLVAMRAKRHQLREAISDQLVAAVNRGQGTLVSVKWHRSAQLDEYGSRLGQLFNLRSPRSERLAAAVDPLALAGIGWRNDVAALAALKDGSEPFLADPTAVMALLRKWDVLFELETFLIEDRPEIRVRFPGDPAGPGRRLGELSLGQARSILLGFLLSSPGNAPLILDQPEDQLDGPFLADTVVGYLHAAKERRQVLVATHNPNVVVLGDAELVLPLIGESGHGEVVDQGSVDATATRAQVLRLLEGGHAAFEERSRRYGYRVDRLPG